MSIKNSDLYINPLHKFYCEFIELVKKALPDYYYYFNNYTIEKLIEVGKRTEYKEVFRQVENISRFLNFIYDKDFVLIHYKPYYALDRERKCLSLRDDSFSQEENIWNLWGGLLKYARGMVFHRYSGAVVINSYSKFFNLNELEECSEKNIWSKIDRADLVEFSTKFDGSTINGRWFNGKLVLSSSNMLDKHKCVQLNEAYRLVEKKDKKIELMLKENHNLTFIFELISPKDSHIVNYGGANDLILIGVKSTKSDYTFSYGRVAEIAEKYGVSHTYVHSTTFKEVLENRGEKKADEAEGFVANIDGYRVKIKYEDYLRVQGIANRLTPNSVIRAIADNCVEELKLNCTSKIDYIDYIMGKVEDYIYLKDKEIKKAYMRTMKLSARAEGGSEDRGNFMKAMAVAAPREICSYVIMLYNNDYSEERLIKSKSGRYIKYKDIMEYLESKE